MGFRPLAFALLLICALSFAADKKVGTTYSFDLSELRPAQGAIGMAEVDAKTEEISERIHEGAVEVAAYLKDNPGKVIVGPPGKSYYLIDGNHKARALLEAGLTRINAEVIADLSDETPAQFWKIAEKKGWVHPFDARGRRLRPDRMPKSLKALKDDPFRSLAWPVRKSGAYEDIGVPFQEFAWADFFRTRIHFEPGSNREVRLAVKKAIRLARSGEAKKLPGFTGDKIRKCDVRRVTELLLSHE